MEEALDISKSSPIHLSQGLAHCVCYVRAANHGNPHCGSGTGGKIVEKMTTLTHINESWI